MEHLSRCLNDPLSATITLTLAYVAYYISSAIYNLYFSPWAKFPGPKIRAISNWPKWMSYIRGDFPHVIKQLHDQYGPIVRMSPNKLDFSTAQAFKDIHGHENIDKKTEKWSDAYTFAELGDGISSLISAPKADHVRMRRIVAHAFSPSALRAQHPIMLQHTAHFLQKLRDISTCPSTSSDPAPVNLELLYGLAIVDLITDLSLGKSFGSLAAGVESDWWTAMTNIFRLGRMSQMIAGSPILQSLTQAYLTLFPRSRPARLLAAREYHVKHVEGMARERMQQEGSDRKDIVHYMLQHMHSDISAGVKGISEAEVLRNLAALLTAGSETTVSLLCGATYFLLRHPASLEQLQDELHTAFPDGAANIEQVELLRLPYLNGVVEEALRLYPPALESLPRMVTQDVVIDGHVVPKGTVVGASPYAAGRAEWNFREAEEWRPERWLGGEEWKGDSRGASCAFGVGPRNCVGMSLALADAKLILASVFLSFDLTLQPDSQDWMAHQAAHLGWEKPALNVTLNERLVAKPRQRRMDSAIDL